MYISQNSKHHFKRTTYLICIRLYFSGGDSGVNHKPNAIINLKSFFLYLAFYSILNPFVMYKFSVNADRSACGC